MAYESIPSSLYDVGDPVKRELWTRVDDNLDDLNSRISNVEQATTKIIVFNNIVKKATEHKIGDIKISLLSLTEFQKQFDDTWVLANGQSVAGSDYQTLTGNASVPDMRGRFLRMKDHGSGSNPGGDLTLGVLQSEGYKQHNHTDSGHSHGITDPQHWHLFDTNTNHSHGITDPSHDHVIDDPGHNHVSTDAGHSHAITDPNHFHAIGISGASGSARTIQTDTQKISDWYGSSETVYPAATGITINTGFSNISVSNAGTGINSLITTTGITINGAIVPGSTKAKSTGITVNSDNAIIGNSGGNETRPINVTVNVFIKINDSVITKRLIYKASAAFTLTSAIVNCLEAGSAGDCEIDIKKGISLGALVSVFSTKPKVNFSAGNWSDSSNAVFSITNVLVGDWLVLDITSFQTEQNKMHVRLVGEI